jgi:type IV fimbrial biogenesis protein FimT
MQNTLSRQASRQRGTTLIESAVVLGIAAAAAGTVIPGMSGFVARQAMTHAAAEFESDVMHARSLAAASNMQWRITFGQDGPHACYIVHTGAPDDCKCQGTGPALCKPGAQALRTAPFAAGGRVMPSANFGSILFDPTRGTSTPAGTVRFVASNGKALHQVINIMGRVRSCAPGGALPGYKAC